MFDVNIIDTIGKQPQTTKKEPIKKESKEYSNHIKKSFKIAFDFLEKHKYARTDEEWQAVFVDIDIINIENNKLLVALLIAAVDEIERNQKIYEVQNV